MDDLIIRVLGGTASPFEVERLERWREESAENEMAYQDLARVWELTAPEAVAVTRPRPSVREVLARAEAGLSADDEHREPHGGPGKTGANRLPSIQRRRVGSRGRGWWLLAASVAALSLGIPALRDSGPEVVAVYEALRESPLTVTLKDGSFVRLAPGARLQEWEGEGERRVSLDGRALFAVARDEERPFVVRGAVGRVRVLGTRFELQSDGESLRTVVLEGRVAVSNREGEVEVVAGEVALAEPGAPPTTRATDDIHRLLDWPGGTLVFQATPLHMVAEEVSRFYGRSLIVAAPRLEARRITAWFDGESFEAVTEALCQAVGAVCEEAGIAVVLGVPGGEEGRP